MADVTIDRKTDQAGTPDETYPHLLSYSVAAATKLLGGIWVALNASGYLVPGGAMSALRFAGRNEALVDNTAGSAGDLKATVRAGFFWFDTPPSGADQLTRADIGSYVFASDNHTANKTDAAGARPVAGWLAGVAADYNGVASGQVLVAVGMPSSYAANPLLAAAEGSGSTFRARNIAAAGNVASLAAFTVAGNDGVTNVAGDVVILPDQTTAAQNGPYVVGVVAAGVAPLTRPSWWSTGAVFKSGITIAVGGEGTVFKNTAWKAMVAADSFTVGTDDPKLYPTRVSGKTALVAGTFTISTVPIFSANSAIHLERAVANTSTATTGGYHPTSGGADGITPGIRGTAAAIIQACVAAGTLNNADISTLHWTIDNQA